jgi:hypothetical protein
MKKYEDFDTFFAGIKSGEERCSLIGRPITQENIDNLAAVLKTNETLLSLEMKNCNINDDMAMLLANSLKANSTLKSFNLNQNKISADCGKKIVSEIEPDNFTLNFISLSQSLFGISHQESALGHRNRNVMDAVSDYANILAVKILNVINSDESISVNDKNNIDLKGLKEVVKNHAAKILLKDMSADEKVNFSNAWHSFLLQQKSLKVKDYGGAIVVWPSLFGSKEMAVPDEVVGMSGYKLVARTTPDELTEEGKKLKHCVGTYTADCNTGNSHIVSIVNPQGEPSSTIQYKSNHYICELEFKQHMGYDNGTPCAESLSTQKWFEREVKSKSIAIDYEGLESARAKREETDVSLEQKATAEFGFKIFDKKR